MLSVCSNDLKSYLTNIETDEKRFGLRFNLIAAIYNMEPV
ncbi:hypothetical protein Sarmat_00933 [Rickettsiales endosymbiont of Paramecium tredecaurelia]|nr:hypothetical protein [Candidatus Sarmatiella mevalonica]